MDTVLNDPSLSFRIRMLNFFRRIFQLRFLETWLASKTQGRRPDHFFAKWVPNPYQYNAGTLRQVCIDGIYLTVDISDYIGHYYFFGFKDPSHEALFSLCHENSKVIDIGINLGYTALRLASIAKSGLVVGFEPDPYNYQRCLTNINKNNLNNLSVLNRGLGNEEGVFTMEVRTESNRGGNRISTDGNGERVNINKLDNLFPSLGLSDINLIKIDVEGYELKVLEGAESVLKNFKPVLFIELDDNNLKDQGDSAQALILFLDRLGYKSIVHAETGIMINSNTNFLHCHYDIIAR